MTADHFFPHMHWIFKGLALDKRALILERHTVLSFVLMYMSAETLSCTVQQCLHDGVEQAQAIETSTL